MEGIAAHLSNGVGLWQTIQRVAAGVQLAPHRQTERMFRNTPAFYAWRLVLSGVTKS